MRSLHQQNLSTCRRSAIITSGTRNPTVVNHPKPPSHHFARSSTKCMPTVTSYNEGSRASTFQPPRKRPRRRRTSPIPAADPATPSGEEAHDSDGMTPFETNDQPPQRPTAPGIATNDDDWDILDSPGLTPPRNQVTHVKNGLLAAVSRALRSFLAVVCPPLASTELLRRLSVTFCMLCLLRVGNYIPVPGLDLPLLLRSTSDALPNVHLEAVSSGIGMAAATAEEQASRVVSLTSALTGSRELPGSIFLLSITPYMTAHLMLAVLQTVFPEVRRHFRLLRDQGRQGQETIQNYTSLLFYVFALAEAIWQTQRLVPLAAISTAATNTAAGMLFFKVQTAVSLVVGATICRTAVQMIDHRGLGDGTGVVIGAGIALSYTQHVASAVKTLLSGPLPSVPNAIAALGVVGALLVAVVWVQGVELRLPLTSFFARRSTTRTGRQHPVLRMLSSSTGTAKEALERRSLLPLRLSPSGTRSLLFANFWVGLIDRPLSLIGLEGMFGMDKPLAFAALLFFLESVSFADATPRQTAEYLVNSDTGIAGLSPGTDTEAFLRTKRRQMKLLNAAFLAVVSLAARAADVACYALTGVTPGCLTLLLLVSTVLGGARQVDALSEGIKVERKLDAEYSLLENIVRRGGAGGGARSFA